MTTRVFLDFGEGFAGGSLTMTASELRGVIQEASVGQPEISLYAGPDLVRDSGASGLFPETQVRLDSLATVVASQALDADGVGGRGDAADYIALRDGIVNLVRRQYEPFDVEVVTAAAGDRFDIYDSMQANAGDLSGQYDAYVFVTGMVRMDTGAVVGTDAQLLGLAAGGDLNAGLNISDELVVVFADNYTGFRPTLAMAMATVASHEAAHTFGLTHVNPAAGPFSGRLTESEVMCDGGGSNNDLRNASFFSRFPLMRGDGNMNVDLRTNSYEQLVNDADIGRADSGVEFVTGTGVNDRITITRTAPGRASVLVQAFSSAAFNTSTVYSYSYDISTTNGVLVDAGLRDDQIILVGDLGTQVTVRGGAGSDTLELRPAGASVIAFSDRFEMGASVITRQETEIIKVTGTGATSLIVDGSRASRSQTLELRSDSIAGLTPRPISFSGLGSLVLLAGRAGNVVRVLDTPPRIGVDLYTGRGADQVTIEKTSSNLRVRGQNGADELNLGQAERLVVLGGVASLVPGTPADIGGVLTVTNGYGLTKLTVNDTGAASYRDIHLWTSGDYGMLTGLGSGRVRYLMSQTDSLRFRGGDYGYQFVIDNTASRFTTSYLTDPPMQVQKFRTNITTGGGSDTFYAYGAASPLSIASGGGGDSFVAGAWSLNQVQAALSLDGGEGSDSLTVVDLFGDQQTPGAPNRYSVEAYRIQARHAAISHSGFDYLKLHTSNYDDEVAFWGMHAGQTVAVSTWDGHDRVLGQSGVDGPLSVFGGAGRDTIFGGAGRNILIGGAEADLLDGGGGEDVLIAGETEYDADPAALDSLMAEWSRTDIDYVSRVEHLMNGGGLNEGTLLNRSSYIPDAGGNSLLGRGQLDLFFGARTRDPHDRDMAAGEVFFDPDAAPKKVAFDYADGVLRIDGGDQADEVRIINDAGQIRVLGMPIDVAGGDGPASWLPENDIRYAYVRGFGGDDHIEMVERSVTPELALSLTAHGQQGNDTLIGGSAVDGLFGGIGRDVISGAANDYIEGDFSVSSQAVELETQLGIFVADYEFENWGGRNEKWLWSDSAAYFMLPSGELYRWDSIWADNPSPPALVAEAMDAYGWSSPEYDYVATGTLVATLDPSYYHNLFKLANARLLVDGALEQEPLGLEAARLDRELGLEYEGELNSVGRNEKWFYGDPKIGGPCYYLLPNGELYRSAYPFGEIVDDAGELVATLDSSYYDDPSKLADAQFLFGDSMGEDTILTAV